MVEIHKTSSQTVFNEHPTSPAAELAVPTSATQLELDSDTQSFALQLDLRLSLNLRPVQHSRSKRSESG